MMAIAGLVLLCWSAISGAGAREVTAVAIYGGSLVLLYACSTFYHGLPAGRARRVMRVMDHLSILLLIAGTYTPFTLVTLRGAWGWSLFGTVWGLAVGASYWS
jgi:hemolysin III